MKTNFIFLLLIIGNILNAQEPPGRFKSNLVFSEVRSVGWEQSYFEFTNRGDTAIQLSNVKFGNRQPSASPISNVWEDSWTSNHYFFLPEYTLEPGESFVIAQAFDYRHELYMKNIRLLGPVSGQELSKQELELYKIANILVHFDEGGGAEDSITTQVGPKRTAAPETIMKTYFGGGATYFLEYHLPNGDSVIIDQVFGVFDLNGRNNSAGGYSVAGVENATKIATLIRKQHVKTGNLDFHNARGLGMDDSEWMVTVLPSGKDRFRDFWWTVGNDGAYVLDENTLESDVIDIDFANKKLSVPWGIGRLDDIMYHMKKKPGLTWHYILNDIKEDSLFRSAQTGDKLIVYVNGNQMHTDTFDIVVKEQTPDANIVVPVDHRNIGTGPITSRTQNGILGWPRVTRNVSGTDTITGSWHGLPNALVRDSLLKYLEKPANATWEFVWNDGVERTYLKNGDKLKVIAQNGNVKEYFLQVQNYNPSNNSTLASITWPDIPEYYKGLFGWTGDTIPNFNPTQFFYTVQIPLDVTEIPAMVAKPENLNASLNVKRATSLTGPAQNRTISFEVIAESDTLKSFYEVELIKEKDPKNIQPYAAEPFFSEVVQREQDYNSYLEICNPGTLPLDLSNYLIAGVKGNFGPSDAIRARMAPTESDWMRRFEKYVPGYKWVDLHNWTVGPGVLELDVIVNPVIQPGDVFVMGDIKGINHARRQTPNGYKWPVPAQLDVQFNNYTHSDPNWSFYNPWGETVISTYGYGAPMALSTSGKYFLFKILNDSVKLGLKPVNDPNDFELVDSWGAADGSNFTTGKIGGYTYSDYGFCVRRKPEISKGNTVIGGSFGTNPDDCEWLLRNRTYYEELLGSKGDIPYLSVSHDLGQHYFYPPTEYISTVTSEVYKVSEGYSMNETIRGLRTGTTVSGFLSNLIKANEGQTLKVISSVDGNELIGEALVSFNDVLNVTSADGSNTSSYKISDVALSSNAELTSQIYEITIQPSQKSAGENSEDIGIGTISGFDYGTTLRTVINNIHLPDGASLTIINDKGAYVPLRSLNYDTTYVFSTVNANTYFEVIAEDQVTVIRYQLIPESSSSDAFVLSDAYIVEQNKSLISIIPRSTTSGTFLSNLILANGASMKLVDKLGAERTDGQIVHDFRLIVTAADGITEKVYFLSMLPTQSTPVTNYLAYVVSDYYTVDNLSRIITGATGTTPLNEFLSRIIPSFGANVAVIDKNGIEKTSGDLDGGDILKVTSADGQVTNNYELDLDLTTTELLAKGEILLYPNPFTGKVNINGLIPGTRIQVFNSIGAVIADKVAAKDMETISMDNQVSGVYVIVLTNNQKFLGSYKVIKK